MKLVGTFLAAWTATLVAYGSLPARAADMPYKAAPYRAAEGYAAGSRETTRPSTEPATAGRWTDDHAKGPGID